jgi:cytochrome c oxidase subunit II
MMYLLADMQSLMVGGLIQRSQRWWWDMNFRGFGSSTFADHADWLFFWIYAITAFFFVLLMVLMFYFTFRYRRRAGVAPVRSRSHNTMLELTWSVVPTIILVWMFFEGFRGYAYMMVAPAQAPEVLVTGQMWNWSVTYPNGAASPEVTRSRKINDERGRHDGDEGVTEIPIFVMPEKMPIKLRMHSLDVIHAFWIPDFRAKFDVYPNRYTSMWFESTGIDLERARRNQWYLDDGTPYQDHWVFCAEYCGSMHSEMAAIIRVVPKEKYFEIIEQWSTPTGTPAEMGAFYYRRYGCNSCHSIDGSRSTGPSFQNLYGYQREFTAADPLTADANYIRESILEPGKKVVQGYQNVMPSFQGRIEEEEEINYLIAFIQSLSDRGPRQEMPAENGEGAEGEAEPGN